MLFVFEAPQPLAFWMKDTYVPLSIAFVDAGGRILNIEDMRRRTSRRIGRKGPRSLRSRCGKGGLPRRGSPPATSSKGLPRFERPRPMHAAHPVNFASWTFASAISACLAAASPARRAPIASVATLREYHRFGSTTMGRMSCCLSSIRERPRSFRAMSSTITSPACPARRCKRQPLQPIMESIVSELGFDSFMYGMSADPRPTRRDTRTFVWTTLPREWVMLYGERGYIEVDPRRHEDLQPQCPVRLGRRRIPGRPAAAATS